MPRHFYPEVRRKNPESRRKNPESRRKKAELGGILFDTFFCTEQHDKTIENFISLGIFFGPRHLLWESAEINAYRQVRHFFCLEEFVGIYIYMCVHKKIRLYIKASLKITILIGGMFTIPKMDCL